MRGKEIAMWKTPTKPWFLRGFKIRKIRLNSYHVEIPFQTMTSRGYLISYLGILNVWGEDVSYCGPNIHFFWKG